jgi:hypothetical protein
MRIRYFISFSVPRSQGDRFKEYIREIGLIEFWEDPHNERALPHMYHTLDGEDPKLAALRDLLRRKGIEWSERKEHVYTDAELRTFPFLCLSIERRPLDYGGPCLGTAYDLSRGCPQCGTGAVQVGPLFLPMTGLPKRGLLTQTVFNEPLVAAPLAEALTKARVSGLELRQVRFYRNEEPLPWWQMIAAHDMPKMSAATRGMVRDTDQPPCPQCERDGHFHTLHEPFEIVYRGEGVDPSTLPDVVQTWERFCCSWIDKEDPRKSRFAYAAILVKPRVFDVFRFLKVKHARFVPVRIVD